MITNKNTQTISKNIKTLFKKSFPLKERVPLWIFKKYLKTGQLELTEYYDENLFIGFTMIAKFDNYAYLLFFATDPSIRSKGYGSQIMQQFIAKYGNNDIMFAIEKVVDFNDLNDNKTRRYNFYKKNGFVLNNFEMKTFMVGKFNIMSNKPLDVAKLEEMLHKYLPHFVKIIRNK